MNKCQYVEYDTRCNIPCKDLFCDKHIKIKCVVCSKQSTHGCGYCGQLVCGAPLCNDCVGFEDINKPCGNWGFLNHTHIKKSEINK